MPAAKTAYDKLTETVCQFVAKQKGSWDHEAWETLLTNVEKLGFALDDEGKRNLGNTLEALKHFYLSAPKPPRKKTAAKKAPAKKKTVANKRA